MENTGRADSQGTGETASFSIGPAFARLPFRSGFIAAGLGHEAAIAGLRSILDHEVHVRCLPEPPVK